MGELTEAVAAACSRDGTRRAVGARALGGLVVAGDDAMLLGLLARRVGRPGWSRSAAAQAGLDEVGRGAGRARLVVMSGQVYRDADLVTVSVAASIACRSVRTIRRAYMAGGLRAYRDANGRGVRIRYGDLRGWLMSEAVQPAVGEGGVVAGFGGDGALVSAGSGSDNLALLSAARERRRRRSDSYRG